MSDSYRPRVVDAELQSRLSAAGAVLIEGPKACGKTETARQSARSHVLLDTDLQAQTALGVDPSLVLAGERPRLIDEWQVAPTIWNHVRRAVDETGAAGQFILTGSAVPADDQVRHTGAGRFSRLRMRPMALFETGHSTGQVSLSGLLGRQQPDSVSADLALVDLVDAIVTGGWPALQGRGPGAALRANRDYLEQISRVDVERVDGVRRDPEKVMRMITSLARNVAAEAKIATLISDVSGAGGHMVHNTAVSYLEALSRLMVIEDQPAWAPHIRSSSALRTAPKRHFADPSLAAAAMRAGPQQLLGDLNALGFLFESLVVRDLRIYAQPLDGQVSHYRDSSGLEVDALVTTPDGAWAAFEVKLGSDRIDAAAASLLKLADVVDTGRRGTPSALCVVTPNGYGYRRPDGVDVVPLSALGP